MALTPSTMIPLGTKAPEFALTDTNGKKVSLADFKSSKGLLVVFMCNHCPYVAHIKQALAAFAREYFPKGLGVVGINSNDVKNYPEDSPAQMAKEVKEFGYTFPYLYDETQSVAKAYHAVCTPDFFLFDKNCMLVYRGQFDESRPGNNKPVTGRDLKLAAEALLSFTTISADQKPSIGCNIKWKS